MENQRFDRRNFLKSAVAGGAAAVAVGLPQSATAQAQKPAAAAGGAAYTFFNPDEAAFVEALVDHMVPADELTAKGTDLGLNIFIDRALAGSWGKGDRLFIMGACVFPHNSAYNPTGPVGALAYWAADALKNRYLKNPGPLISA